MEQSGTLEMTNEEIVEGIISHEGMVNIIDNLKDMPLPRKIIFLYTLLDYSTKDLHEHVNTMVNLCSATLHKAPKEIRHLLTKDVCERIINNVAKSQNMERDSEASNTKNH